MKFCDSCRSSYPGDFTVCPKDQATLRSVSELPPGALLRGKYEILKKLGAGGMGAVYKARHLAFDELRALKIIGGHLLENEDFLNRFRAEAVNARKLQHANVVRVEDYDTTEDGHPFIVMEYAEGKSLRAVIRESGALGVRRAVEIAAQTCAALAAAHKLGILHRDVKPDNVMLVTGADGREQAKVLDFGLAKVIEGFSGSADQVATSTGMIMGTPHYMAPEQAMGKKAGPVDGRVDLYALGIVLYEMLTGAVPFDSDTPMGVVLQHIQTAAVPPHEAYPDRRIPPEVSGLVMRALEKDPARRFASADKMLQALQALLPTLPAGDAALGAQGGAMPPPRTAAVLSPQATSSVLPTVPVKGRGRPPREGRPTPRVRAAETAEPDETRSSGAGWLWAAAIVALVLGFWALRRLNEPAPAAEVSPPPVVAPAAAATPVFAASARPAARGDEDIRSDIQHVLFFSGPLHDARIDVEVAGGVVTLSGQAPSQMAQELAGSLASTVAGVRRVFNAVKVTAEAAAPVAAPSEQAPPATEAAAPSTPAPAPPRDEKGEKVRALLDQARQAIEAGNHDQAARLFEEVLAIDPQNPEARAARARGGPPPRPR